MKNIVSMKSTGGPSVQSVVQNILSFPFLVYFYSGVLCSTYIVYLYRSGSVWLCHRYLICIAMEMEDRVDRIPQLLKGVIC